jgi:hypothetical protein
LRADPGPPPKRVSAHHHQASGQPPPSIIGHPTRQTLPQRCHHFPLLRSPACLLDCLLARFPPLAADLDINIPRQPPSSPGIALPRSSPPTIPSPPSDRTISTCPRAIGAYTISPSASACHSSRRCRSTVTAGVAASISKAPPRLPPPLLTAQLPLPLPPCLLLLPPPAPASTVPGVPQVRCLALPCLALPCACVPVAPNHLLGVTDSTSTDTSHVPCKFFRQGACQAGNACPFSHDLGAASETVCKYFAKVRPRPSSPTSASLTRLPRATANSVPNAPISTSSPMAAASTTARTASPSAPAPSTSSADLPPPPAPPITTPPPAPSPPRYTPMASHTPVPAPLTTALATTWAAKRASTMASPP